MARGPRILLVDYLINVVMADRSPLEDRPAIHRVPIDGAAVTDGKQTRADSEIRHPFKLVADDLIDGDIVGLAQSSDAVDDRLEHRLWIGAGGGDGSENGGGRGLLGPCGGLARPRR